MAAKSLQKLNEANGELINDESNLEAFTREPHVIYQIYTYM